MPGRVREQVAEHLHDALRVGHRPRQVGRKVDEHGMAAPAGQERGAGLVDERGDVRGLGRDGERPRLDAARVEEVRDQAPHAVGLPVDDAEELAHLGPGRGRGGVEHGRRRALDRGERRAQLVAHHLEELRPLPLELLERREILHRDDDRDDHAVVRPDGGGVDERAHAPPVGHRQLDLLGAGTRTSSELVDKGKLFEGDLPPVGAPAGHHVEELFGGAARCADLLGDAPRLTVERDRPAGGRVQRHDADRRGLDQCLEVGPRPLHVAVRPGVRDRRRRLRSEEHQDLLVLGGERLPVLLVAEEEVAEMLAPVVHRSSLQRPGGSGDREKAERFQVAGEVRHPQRPRTVPQVLEEPGPVRPVHQLPALLRRQAGGDEVLESSRLVDGRDHALTGAGEGPRAVDHLLEHGAQIEAPADAEDRRAQPGRAVRRGSAPVRIADRSAPAAG